MSDDALRDAKQRAVAMRRSEKMADKAVRRRELRCFWTWPWGHVWRPVGYDYDYVCAVCEKEAPW